MCDPCQEETPLFIKWIAYSSVSREVLIGRLLLNKSTWEYTPTQSLSCITAMHWQVFDRRCKRVILYWTDVLSWAKCVLHFIIIILSTGHLWGTVNLWYEDLSLWFIQNSGSWLSVAIFKWPHAYDSWFTCYTVLTVRWKHDQWSCNNVTGLHNWHQKSTHKR